ncbi:MAG TPA: hypothetical protein VEM15_13960, partial [Thermodesulfobacteriota bacterium]|nr:hypothetical protein [Thermodesulfobacteriota bacterium]
SGYNEWKKDANDKNTETKRLKLKEREEEVKRLEREAKSKMANALGDAFHLVYTYAQFIARRIEKTNQILSALDEEPPNVEKIKELSPHDKMTIYNFLTKEINEPLTYLLWLLSAFPDIFYNYPMLEDLMRDMRPKQAKKTEFEKKVDNKWNEYRSLFPKKIRSRMEASIVQGKSLTTGPSDGED